MMKSLTAWMLGAAALASGPAFAQDGAPKAPEPKLIVAISVDQLSTDLFNEYRDDFNGGLKRLAGGIAFPNGYQSHAATETCPGHSTILTGSRPARTGIIANSWFDPTQARTGKNGKADYGVYCSEDTSIEGSNSSDYTVSPKLLKVPTLGDRMRAANPASQVVAVSGKDRGAVMMGGHNTTLTMWWDGKSFRSYAGSEAAIPKGAALVNSRAKAAIDKPAAVKLPTMCASHSRGVSIGGDASVGTLQQRKPGDARAFRASGEFDSLTMDLALAAFGEKKLGRGAATDVLAISLSATDYIGHTFGTAGAETCTQMAALDATLGRMFAALDKSKVPYLVVLTADHGGHDLPERNNIQGLPAAERADIKLMPQGVGPALAKAFDLPEPAIMGDAPFGDMYLSTKIPAAKRSAVLDAALKHYRTHPQVEAVITKDEIAATPSPSGPPEDWSLIQRVRANFDPSRSGDFYVALKRYVTPIPNTSFGYVATHGSPWGYDRRVPILFWWKGVAPYEQPNGIETVDILPTLASLIGLDVPKDEIDGRCVDLMAGAASNCK
ncbi:alkaline phosphatase family protein [Sphingorhabdus pulchriflava]|uniref:Alkaline phosphatase n=1 Tax=Sphingorhabdus pulchriflava TaxID=2292257 RepID=A0A371BF98_9SPHN|nr:alkaline phosphatase family protein [Sphingorhabdus pulchriflava]RDV06187.1 alkaline phosphatase family protein [Sphingorhabdus pulchriflava]